MKWKKIKNKKPNPASHLKHRTAPASVSHVGLCTARHVAQICGVEYALYRGVWTEKRHQRMSKKNSVNTERRAYS